MLNHVILSSKVINSRLEYPSYVAPSKGVYDEQSYILLVYYLHSQRGNETEPIIIFVFVFLICVGHFGTLLVSGLKMHELAYLVELLVMPRDEEVKI